MADVFKHRLFSSPETKRPRTLAGPCRLHSQPTDLPYVKGSPPGTRIFLTNRIVFWERLHQPVGKVRICRCGICEVRVEKSLKEFNESSHIVPPHIESSPVGMAGRPLFPVGCGWRPSTPPSKVHYFSK